MFWKHFIAALLAEMVIAGFMVWKTGLKDGQRDIDNRLLQAIGMMLILLAFLLGDATALIWHATDFWFGRLIH